ncbi:SDR family oxidoreductase [Hymenobacter setariae]|uniref:SDR family oxidoreductase n=1 Tax=Hymenobacter setariae TaxID=2594794 RepID=A0A558BS56_9BACT|nr:SDR family oxidoreductase [Hymenobacter setariae]TVT39331.1 SDR family oxidoreductase [Hymenobacter setariae]
MKTWFITGTSSGFGRKLTEKLLERGDRVAATVRNATALTDLQARYGDRLWVATLDLTDPAAIRRVVDAAFAELGRIEVVVSNAAYGLFGASEEVTDEQIRHQIDTNLVGSIQLIRAVLPYLRAQGGGRIMQLSSAGGQTTYPNFSLYHATKWGIEGFAETVAKEVAPFNIGVTIVEPGATHTNFASGLVQAPVMEAYEHTPAGDVRRALLGNTFPIPGDADKMAQAMLDSADHAPAPLRLALGRDTYADVRAALVARLAALDAQREIAQSMVQEGA